MIDIAALYDSLLDASFRGVTFSVIDCRDEVGRRVQSWLFPGRDERAWQDLGAFDGPLRIAGLISGDDYVQQANRLRAAFRTAGPATLILPWRDDLVVVLEKPASISFSQKELRIVRFEASFLPFTQFATPPPDTLQGLLDDINGAMTQARAWLAELLKPLILPLAVFAYAQRFVGRVATYWTYATSGGLASDILGSAAAARIAALSGAPASPANADITADALLAVPVAIAQASVPTPPAAIGPGGSAATHAAADPAATATLLLGVAARVALLAGDPQPGPMLACALQAAIVIQAIAAASDIIFASQLDATAWRDRLLAGLDASITAAAVQAQAAPTEAGALWRSLVAVRASFLADMSAAIGRLPPVNALTLVTSAPAWLVAQYLSGDAPGGVVATYRDLVARNGIRHPAMVGPGVLEVLA
jgi:hypothetical protein